MIWPFKKEKWALVKSLKVQGKVYAYHIHLFESDKGKRKMEFKQDGKPADIKDTWLYKDDLYQMKVYRWLNGRRDPEIPTYSEIGEEDTANYLKGKVS